MSLQCVERLPWYDHQGLSSQPYIIGISGGSGSGKTSIAKKIIDDLAIPWITLLSMDSFYKSLTDDQREQAYRNEYDFDHPNSFDYDILYDSLLNLKKGIKVDIPKYDFTTHSRLPQTESLYGANVIIFEGIFSFHDKKVRDLLDLKVFVACDDDIRLARRLKRDISERGRDLNGVLHQYHKFVKPSYDTYIKRTMDFADIVLPKGIDSQASMDLIIQHVLLQHMNRCFPFKDLLNTICFDEKAIPSTLHVLDQTSDLKSCIEKLNDEKLELKEFLSISDELVVMLLRFVSNLFEKSDGLTVSKICGVFLERYPSSIKIDFNLVYTDALFGKLCIRTLSNGEPGLYLCDVPEDICNRKVIIFDAQCSTGSAAVMAIRVLLDHCVLEENIIFCSLVCSRSSAILIHSIFPKVVMVSCRLENSITAHQFPVLANLNSSPDSESN